VLCFISAPGFLCDPQQHRGFRYPFSFPSNGALFLAGGLAAGAAVGSKPHVGRWQGHSNTSPGASGKSGALKDGRMVKNKLNQAQATEKLEKNPI